MMISGCAVRLWRTSIKESNVTAQRAHKLLRYSKNFNYEIQAERIARRNWILAVRLDVNVNTRGRATTPRILWMPGRRNGKKYFDSIPFPEFFNFQSRTRPNLFERVFVRDSRYLCVIFRALSDGGAILHSLSDEYFRYSSHANVSLTLLILFYFFANSSAHWKNSRATIILVFTIRKRILRGNGGNTWKEIEFVKEMNPRNN